MRLQIKSKSGVAREATEQSDGTKALIAFAVFNLLNSDGIIAIDEPETHLHPSAQRDAYFAEHGATAGYRNAFWGRCWRV